jgi:hypothetical protein
VVAGFLVGNRTAAKTVQKNATTIAFVVASGFSRLAQSLM